MEYKRLEKSKSMSTKANKNRDRLKMKKHGISHAAAVLVTTWRVSRFNSIDALCCMKWLKPCY
jgi:hypothetical protein